LPCPSLMAAFAFLAAQSITLAPAPLKPHAHVGAQAPSLLSLTPDAAAPVIGGTGRAKLVWDLVRNGEDPFGEVGAEHLPATTHRALRAAFTAPTHSVVAESASSDGTRKLLLALPAGGDVETVVIPHSSGAFSTLCVSSQVGCRQACSFCATGTMGLLRSLGPEEICSQVSGVTRPHAVCGRLLLLLHHHPLPCSDPREFASHHCSCTRRCGWCESGGCRRCATWSSWVRESIN